MQNPQSMDGEGSAGIGATPVLVLLFLLVVASPILPVVPGLGGLIRAGFPLSVGAGELHAQVLLTQDEALELAFPPPATVERRSAFLEEAQVDEVRRLAGDEVEVDQTIVTHYVAHRNGEPLGVAYFDAHRVRTMREVVMVVVSPAGLIDRVEVLRFAEPPEYMASEQWIDQLEGQTLDPELEVGRDIINMTGATLTSEALTRASRRILAIHEVVRPFADEGGGGG